jgi:hypothetical protein
MPYSKRGRVKLSISPSDAEVDADAEAEAEAEAEDPEDKVTIDSAEYAAVVSAYTNKKGELSYDLLNKDFIQFAHSSKIVGDMVQLVAGFV